MKFFPEHISSLILYSMRTNSMGVSFGEATNKVVITVPANFNHTQRRQSIECGGIAGFDVIDVVSEPTTDAICFASETPFTEIP
jgi:molecular chaperone DnaK (HSP70)